MAMASRCAPLFYATALALTLAVPSFAASLEVAPTTLRIDASTGVTVLQLANRGSDPIIVQIEGLGWQQSGASEELKPSEFVIVSPPMARIKPGEKQTVRILVRPGGAPGMERAFRILASELPDPASTSPQAVRVLLQFSIPLFAGAPAAAPPQLSWDASVRGNELLLSGHNLGLTHIKLAKLELSTESGQRVGAAQGLSYVLAGATHEWKVAPASVLPGDRLLIEGHAEDSDAVIRGAVVVRP